MHSDFNINVNINLIYTHIKKKLMIKKYGRNLKRYFTDIVLPLTNNFNRHNQKLLKRIVRGILKAFAWK